MTSETGSNPSNADTASRDSEQGSFAGVKDQIDDLTRSSVTDFKENFAVVAGDAVNSVKETVPVAVEALQSAQDRVRSLVKGVEDTVEPGLFTILLGHLTRALC
jgi:hypothetical protein